MPEAVEQTIEILLVDDHAHFRESVARLLSAEPGFKVVAHCGSIETALQTVRQRHVDVVLLDFDLGEREGTQFLRLAKQQGFGGKILIVTAGVVDSEAADLIRNGVSGIFMKHNSAALLAQGIRDVMAGKVLFGPRTFVESYEQCPKGLVKRHKTSHLRKESVRCLLISLKGWPTKRSRSELGYPRLRSKLPYSNSSQKRASEHEVNWSVWRLNNTEISSKFA